MYSTTPAKPQTVGANSLCMGSCDKDPVDLREIRGTEVSVSIDSLLLLLLLLLLEEMVSEHPDLPVSLPQIPLLQPLAPGDS